MDDQSKTKQVLSQELSLLRQKIAELEQSESDRKNVDGVLKDREAELTSIYENTPLIVLLVDKEWAIRKTNAFTAQLVGRAVGDMINLRCGESLHCIHSLDAPEGCGFGPSCEECTLRLTAINTIETGQSHHEVEARMSLSDGEKKREVIFLLSTARLTIKRQPMALISMQDITKRKQAEEALRESEAKYRQLVESLNEGIWVIDEQAVTTFVNPRMVEMLGYTVEGMLGRHLFSFMDEQGVQIATRNLARRQQGIKEQHDFEFLHKDGTRVNASLETAPVTDLNGNYRGAIAGVVDITDRRQAEEQLRLKTENLEEVNTALKVLLRQLEESKAELIGTMLSNIRELVLPHIHKLKDSSPSAYHISLLNIVETNLDNIASSFLHQLKFKYYNLTPREIEVATLVKEGRSIKEIAALLNISISTVQFHRISLREKLGLKDRKTNLRSYLLSLH